MVKYNQIQIEIENHGSPGHGSLVFQLCTNDWGVYLLKKHKCIIIILGAVQVQQLRHIFVCSFAYTNV